MKQQKHYIFLQRQILLMIGLSLIPGISYVIFGWVFDIFLPSFLWYISLIIMSIYGFGIHRYFETHTMEEDELKRWYRHLKIFLYTSFLSWAVIFLIYVTHKEYNLHYIAIFTELGASVVASTLLVSDKKLFVPILLTLMLPLVGYFFLIGVWFGYVLSVFSFIFLGVLLYAAYNTNYLLEENYYQAQHDILTGLYNRRYFMDYVEPLHKRLKQTKKVASILLIDLDHFKTINDSLGHDVGDKLLIEVSKRLEKCCHNGYILSRLGGDEFILIGQENEKTKETQEKTYNFALTLLEEIRRPYVIDSHHLYISASVGLHELSNDAQDVSIFIKEVDIAMYEAKSQGRDGVIVFHKNLSQRVERNLFIEQKLYAALNSNSLEVYYQPQFNLENKIVGCEALIRWFDKELGTLDPTEFIAIAENTGLILELGSYVLHETFQMLYDWNQQGFILETFSINISIRQLLYESFIEEVEVLYRNYFEGNTIHQQIIFEITEHVFAEDLEQVIKKMKRLKQSGITFSIDDFGTGYSSLSSLQDLPIAEVKIDKSFIASMGTDVKSRSMIGTIVSIAKNFNLSIVAEGVENETQLKILEDCGCDVFQGFLFDEALSKESFEQKYLTT